MTAPMILYTFLNEDDQPVDSFSTQDLAAAREYAQASGLGVIENTYEWEDSNLVEDFRDEAEDEG